MSKIHVLKAGNSRNYQVVIHTPVPSGSNSVSVTYKDCLLQTGEFLTTILSVGTGPGQILQTEKDTIVAGDVAEIVTTINEEASSALDEVADTIIAEIEAQVVRQYKFFGHTQGT